MDVRVGSRLSAAVYRIERRDEKTLHLYRTEVLADVESVSDQDSLADIERWGTNVAWAEDYTSVERWESDQPGDGWRVLTAVPFRYVTWQHEETVVWDEVDSTGWVARHIEASGEMRYVAAASLAEVVSARDSGGIAAVQAYERTFGAVPEAPVPVDVITGLDTVSGLEFVQRWTAAREALTAGQQSG